MLQRLKYVTLAIGRRVCCTSNWKYEEYYALNVNTERRLFKPARYQ